MKTITVILTILLAWLHVTARAEVPPVQTLAMTWDYANPVGMTFYLRDRVGIVSNVVAVVKDTNVVTLTNVIAGPHNWSVTASNMWGESDPSVPFLTPTKPETPGQIRPLSTMFKFKPPVSFETTSDLILWNERFRLFKPDSNGVQVVMQTVRPDNPFQFYRVRPTPMPGMPGN